MNDRPFGKAMRRVLLLLLICPGCVPQPMLYDMTQSRDAALRAEAKAWARAAAYQDSLKMCREGTP